MGKLRVYCLKTLNKLSIYPLGNTPSAPSDCLDGEADHAAERISALEDKEADMERSLNALLELGREQTEALTRAA